jgi:hypothetical protein
MENNRFDLFVDVLKSKQKILILANSPHPDISAIKDAISSNINYVVDDELINDFNGPVEEYSLVILHQLPSRTAASARVISSLNRAQIPLFYILGSQTDLNIFNAQRTGLHINIINSTLMNEVTPVLNEDFSAFTINEELATLVPFLPPLNTHFARYDLGNASGLLFFQKNGNLVSQNPLWLFMPGREVKTATITGTGLWKWRMKCWQETGSHDLFNEIINKSIQFLALKEDKRKFRLLSPESIAENVPLVVNAELYNESFEAFNEPDVDIKITDDEGNTYDYVFSRTETAYTLDAGTFPVGTYTYQATVGVGGQVLTDAGGFSVLPVIAEQISLRASHDLLEELSRKNDGRLIKPEELDSLPRILKDRGDVKPIIHSEKKFIEFIDIWWILILILSLLSLEWFLRKWSGSY